MFDFDSFGLSRGGIMLIDSAPLIYLVEGGSPRDAGRAESARAFLAAARAGGLRLAASTLAWTECLAGPLADADAARADEFRRRLSGAEGLVFEPVDIAVAEEAARLLSLPAPRPSFADAVHLATAAALGASAVLTNDDAWPGIVAAAGRHAADRNAGASPARAYKRMRVVLVDELAF